MNLTLDLQQACDSANLPSEARLTKWLQAALTGHLESAEVSVRIVEASESQELNQQYRGINKPTNILSFPFELPPGVPAEEMNFLLGDLVVCATVVAQEAAQQNKDLQHHWAHMVIHGALHLLGFDHIESVEAEQMEQMEREILAGLDISDPYKGEF
ncbi:rRNA maturation RNase YbeY [Reinekea sp.]|uniref:rRNA maturation RNase YbeY n=1 Tax=Reinekea sp. TaxID=1970455 RepID=UPI002A82F39C|nr:rRNA maturation RNase YbeY [Reinekea sp.]